MNYMIENSLGAWIRLGLQELGQNQVWLANKIGVQPPQVSRIIGGGSEATPDILAAIADALGKPRIQAFRAAGYIEKVTIYLTHTKLLSSTKVLLQNLSG